MEDIFKALSSAVRRRMLNHLANGPLTAGEIAGKFDMTKPSISKHLGILRAAGLITEEKRGQFVHYQIADENLINSLYGFLSNFCPEARTIKKQRAQRADNPPTGPTDLSETNE